MNAPSAICAASLLACVLAAPAAAQTMWVQTPTPLAPSIRDGHAAYDHLRARLVVFSGALANDTWELVGATWTRRAPAQSPIARVSHGMAYNPGTGRIVMFGGQGFGPNLVVLDDTWEWDGVNWTLRQPAQSPIARHEHAMATDWLSGRVVMFGGADVSPGLRNDTWAWNGTNWTQLAATGPSPRINFDFAQDVTRARFVLFGGLGPNLLGDTWEFDGVAWQQQHPTTAPSARHGHAMCFDPVRNSLLLHGGTTGPSQLWRWDGIGWTLIDTSHARWRHVICYDAWVGRPTMFGGVEQNGTVNTTWTFGPVSPATVVPFGSACAGPAGAPQLRTQGATLPSIGSTVTLGVAPVSALALLLFGWSDTASGSFALPYSLAPHGAPGCTVLVSPDAVFGLAASGSAATIAVNVPFAPEIVGMRFFNQAVSFDTGANPLGLTVSNGTTATIGWQ